jgi:hypothetical protein
MRHDESLTQIKFALLLREYLAIPFYKFRKRFVKWNEIKQFSAEHQNCCHIHF